MSLSDQYIIAALEDRLLAVLAGQTLSEYQLIEILKALGLFPFLDSKPAKPHQLFCAHFLLFHVLYQLRDKLWREQQGCLKISPLAIEVVPYQPGDAQLTHHDVLREYYLNLENLRETSEEEVDEMLAGFWRKMAGFEKREEALAVLGLSDPVSDEAIRRRYKALVMEHHPDRGGEHDSLVEINEAMAALKL